MTRKEEREKLRIGPAPVVKSATAETDEQVMARWRKIMDPREALRVIVAEQNYLGYDSYYEDLRTALLDMAERCSNDES